MEILKKIRALREHCLGFAMEETMTGTHEFCLGHPVPLFMEFKITWGPGNILEWLNPKSPEFLQQPAFGTITIEGVVKDETCWGTLKLDYFRKGKLTYELFFRDRYGVKYKYVGEKVNIKPWNLLTSHTTCFGTLIEVDTERLVSRSVTRFRLRTVPKFLASFGLTA